MTPTKLLYMEDMQLLECTAYVDRIENKDGKSIVYLDRTVFYPQGGGQPYDTGTITSQDTTFIVEEVRYSEGNVQHIGRMNGLPFMAGEDVTCVVAKERRVLHTRLHSGGHLLDMAVYELGYTWSPSKGYHFPDGPNVEYQGELGEETADEVALKLNDTMAKILKRDLKTEIRFVSLEEMKKLCRQVPENIPLDKPSRVVLYGDFGVPCGGTHVALLKDIGEIKVRKIKAQTSKLRISYELL